MRACFFRVFRCSDTERGFIPMRAIRPKLAVPDNFDTQNTTAVVFGVASKTYHNSHSQKKSQTSLLVVGC